MKFTPFRAQVSPDRPRRVLPLSTACQIATNCRATLRETRRRHQHGKKLDLGIAPRVARGLGLGAGSRHALVPAQTGFRPKHDAFLSFDDGQPMEAFKHRSSFRAGERRGFRAAATRHVETRWLRGVESGDGIHRRWASVKLFTFRGVRRLQRRSTGESSAPRRDALSPPSLLVVLGDKGVYNVYTTLGAPGYFSHRAALRGCDLICRWPAVPAHRRRRPTLEDHYFGGIPSAFRRAASPK